MDFAIEEIQEHWEKVTKPKLEECYANLVHDPNLTLSIEKILNRVDTDILQAKKDNGFEYNEFEQVLEPCIIIRPVILVITDTKNYAVHTVECSEKEKQLIKELGDELSLFYKLIQYGPSKKKDDQKIVVKDRVENDKVELKDIYGIDKNNVKTNLNLRV